MGNGQEQSDLGKRAAITEEIPTPTTSELLLVRGSEYGLAWKATGDVLGDMVLNGLMSELAETSYTFNWVMIHNKLVRALQTPRDRDHWADIIGYAQLVLEDIDSENA